MTKDSEKDKIVHQSLRRIYDLKGLTQGELADAINESPQTVNNWESRGISKQGAFKVSNEFNIDIKWILTGEGHPGIERITIGNSDNKASLHGRWVPVKSYSKMGMDGFYTEMDYLGSGGDGYVPSLSGSQNAYAVRGSGQSMYPAIRHGWYVVCDPEAEPTPTEFVEVQLKDGRRTIKEYIGVTGGALHLLAVNGGERISIEMNEVDRIVAVIDIVPPSRHIQNHPNIPKA